MVAYLKPLLDQLRSNGYHLGDKLVARALETVGESGECPNQAFVPVDDESVLAHLQGKHVMGLYPLLQDETCWFLAVDFDKSTWTEDVAAFAETCRRAGVPAAVERSRSGNGAHAWFFFSAPVAASTARKVGCYLLTETMSRRPELSMDSYDRLFPSQDTMPRGGFGNLIALPLQREPRNRGNSVFLDEELAPYLGDQQWAYLASVPRIDPTAVERIAREASRRGSVLGVRCADAAPDDAPWMRRPSGPPGGKRKRTGRLDVAMIQSLVRGGEVSELVAAYGQIIVDECHHLPAVSFERVLAEAKARYLVGLTGTPQRRDGHHPLTEMQLGPVRYRIDARSQAAQRPFAHRLIARETAFELDSACESQTIQQIYAALAADEARNQLILDDVIATLEEGRSPILLTERKDHLEYFANRLAKFARHVVVLQGGMGARARRETEEQLAAIPPDAERLVLATGRYIGEGFDDARLDTLFLALPVSWKGTLVQYTGRLHRLHPGKTEVRIYDYVDRQVAMLERMFERRLRGYRAIGYARGEAPFGHREPPEEPFVEYDEDVLRALSGMDGPRAD